MGDPPRVRVSACPRVRVSACPRVQVTGSPAGFAEGFAAELAKLGYRPNGRPISCG